MSASPSEHQLLRYLTGDLHGEEAAFVRSFIEHSPARLGALAGLRQALDTGCLSYGVTTPDSAALANLFATIDAIENTTPVYRRASGRRWPSLAQFVMAIGLLVIGWGVASQRIERSLATHSSIYATGNGERATITLPDGSQVMLNVASQLQVPANYSRGNRTVILDGEALFSVTDHSGSPFTVMAGPSITRVLGTTFVVRHYATDTAAMVLVQDGKVNVHSAVLSRSQQIFVSRHGVGPIQTANAGSLSFSRGALTLASMSLGDAVTELNRWYNVDIRIADPLIAQERISGEFRAGSITDLAEHLELAFNLRTVREGRVLTLYSR